MYKKLIKTNLVFIVVIVSATIFFHLRLPFFVYKNGGYVNLNDRVEVFNYDKEGSLNMAYVTVLKGTPYSYLMSKIIKSWDLVPKSKVVYEGISIKDNDKINKMLTNSSKDLATLVAYTSSKNKIDIKEEKIYITNVLPNANTELELFDEIIDVDGNEIKDTLQLREYFGTKNLDEPIKIKVKRDNEIINTTNYLFDYGEGNKLIGISITKHYDFLVDPPVNVKLKKRELGPSAGLMLTLAIYNDLVPEDITKGKKIVGSGEIDEFGNVGAIGGLKYKLLGSKDADIFFVAKDNYKVAKEIKDSFNLKFKLIKVSTFDEALNYLKAL